MSNLDNEELIATRILNGIDKAETAKEYIKLKRKANKYDSLVKKIEDKFDNIKKQKLPYFETVGDMIKYKGYAEGKIESYNEILKMVKGEE